MIRSSKTKSLAMKKSDKYFSLYIRKKYANHEGVVQCYTCGNFYHWKKIQCGHWRRRGLQPTRYDERNVRPQCVRCNHFRSGEPERFENNLIRELGEKEVEKIRIKSLMNSNRKKHDFEYIAKEYKQKLGAL